MHIWWAMIVGPAVEYKIGWVILNASAQIYKFWTNYELAHGLYILAARVLQKIMGVHLYTHVPLLRPPLDLQELPHAGGDLHSGGRKISELGVPEISKDVPP